MNISIRIFATILSIIPLLLTHSETIAATSKIKPAAAVCEPDYRSPLFDTFVRENAISSNYTPPALRELFRIQGLRQWLLVNEESNKQGFNLLPPASHMMVDISSPHAQGIVNGFYTQDQYQKISQQIVSININVSSANPISIMTEMLKSHNALRSENYALAWQTAHAALARSRAVNGPGNAAEVLGHFVVAQAAYQEGQIDAALRSINDGLAVISAHPDRSRLLGGYKVTFLLMLAEIKEKDLLANQVPPPGTTRETVTSEIAALRGQAENEIEIGRTTFGSPYFDAASVVPLLQPAAKLSWTSHAAILGTPEQLSASLTTLSAMLPSGDRGSTRPTTIPTGNALLAEIEKCLAAESYASDSGDFHRSRQVRQAILNLLNDRNAKVLLRDIKRDSEDDEHVAVSEVTALTASPGRFLAIAKYALVEGEASRLVRHLESLLTPALINAGIDAAINQQEEDDDEVRKRLTAAKPIAQGAVRLALDLVATLSGDSNRERAQRLSSAMRTLTGDRVDSIARGFYSLAENDDADKDDIAEARNTYRLVGLGVGSLAWMNANSAGDQKLASKILADLAAASKRVVGEIRPGATTTVQKALDDLGSEKSNSNEVFASSADLITFVAETLSIDEDERFREALADKQSTDQKKGRGTGSMISGLVLMPAADNIKDYDQVLKIGSHSIPEFKELLKDEYSDEDDKAKLTSVGGAALAAYANALMARGRSAEAAKFVDEMLPKQELLVNLPDGFRRVADIAVSDAMLDAGVRANSAVTNTNRAFEIARVRIARSNNFLQTQLEINDRSLRDAIHSPRAPYEQLIALAANQSGDASIPWNDVLASFNAIRRSETAEAQILRAAAFQAGPVAQKAYEDFVIAQAAFESFASPASLAYGSLIQGKDLYDHTREHWLKADAFYESRETLLASLPNAIAARINNQASLQELQSVLRPDEVVLAHAVTEGRVAILAIPARGEPIIVWSPFSANKIGSMIAQAKREFQLPDRYSGQEQIAAPDPGNLGLLYDALIRPVEAQMRASKHIIWSPDSGLAATPILALRAPGEFIDPDGNATDYVGLGKSLTFAPRLDSFALARRAGRLPARGALAIGDVTYSEAQPVGTVSNLRPMLGPMPPTKNAKAAIDAFVSTTGGQALTRNAASLSNLMQLPRQHLNMLMFYVHGSDARRQRPAALLLQGDGPSQLSEFTPSDVLQSPVTADLVLLAACNTGAGHTESGAPYSGLVMSYLARGSTAVLSAQQQVDEEAAYRIVAGLSRELSANTHSPAAALREQIFVLSKEKKFSNPVIWSQFLWVGDGAR